MKKKRREYYSSYRSRNSIKDVLDDSIFIVRLYWVANGGKITNKIKCAAHGVELEGEQELRVVENKQEMDNKNNKNNENKTCAHYNDGFD